MNDNNTSGDAAARSTLDMPADEFRRAGHALVDEIANFYDSLRERPLTRSATPSSIRALLGGDELPEEGADAGELLREIAPLLFDHSLHNGHPRFLGYITSSGAPLGALADLLAAAVNANLGKWDLSPIASEIETQTVRWLAEFIGYEPGCSGIMVSGGNMANILGFIAGRTAKAQWDLRTEGNYGDPRRLTAYVSRETHTWVQKAADICGLGAEGVRELSALCRAENLWLHADGAYGAPAAVLPEADDDLRSLDLADSVALDPHKWLYCPIEAACTLTRDPDALSNAFAFYPEYYLLDGAQEEGINYYELGMQNSRGFRALKVWLALRAAGRSGYEAVIRGDIELARRLYELADAHAELRAASHHLSITTFRYVPPGIDEADDYLNALNKALLAKIQASGDFYVSNAVINGVYLLRACVVNFRTTDADMDAIAETVVAMGREVHAELGGAV